MGGGEWRASGFGKACATSVPSKPGYRYVPYHQWVKGCPDLLAMRESGPSLCATCAGPGAKGALAGAARFSGKILQNEIVIVHDAILMRKSFRFDSARSAIERGLREIGAAACKLRKERTPVFRFTHSSSCKPPCRFITPSPTRSSLNLSFAAGGNPASVRADGGSWRRLRYRW